MPGGILQIVAKGKEDIYLTDDPNITFFKTVYRRHTNFSRTELDINFANKLDFGKEGYCRLGHHGDLLHRLFLVIKLPRIKLSFTQLTVQQVQDLLAPFGIVWITSKDPLDKFTESDYCEDPPLCNRGVKKLIDDRLIVLQKDEQKFDSFLTKLGVNGNLYWNTWKMTHLQFDDTVIILSTGATEASSRYLDSVIDDFITGDNYQLQYNIVTAHYRDITNYDDNITPTPNQLPLSNSTAIQNTMLTEFIKYTISDLIYPPILPPGYNDENLNFLYNVDTANYLISGSINQLNSSTVFRSAINTTYGSIPYTYLDAYQIFNSILNENNVPITSSSDVQNIKALLMDNIRFGLVKNIKMLVSIYNSLYTDSRFIFYRKFPVLTPGSGVYDTNALFTNQSLLTNSDATLNDNFTSDFTLIPEINEPSDVDHPMSDFATTTVNNFHSLNRELFRDSKLTQYFNDIVNLWSKSNVLGNANAPVLTPPPPANMFYMNYLWYNMNEDIPAATQTYLAANGLGLSPVTINNLITVLNTTKTTILNVIKPKISFVDPIPPPPLPAPVSNYDIMRTLDATVKTLKGATGDIILMCIIRPGVLNTLVQVGSNYITIAEYITVTYNSAIDAYGESLVPPEKDIYLANKIYLKNIVGLFSVNYDTIPSYSTWLNQNKNIFPNNQPLFQINNKGSSSTVYSDVQCSIWNYLFSQFIKNYNNMYNELLLGLEYYTNNLGIEIKSYLEYISNNFLSYNVTPTSFYDYYRNVEKYVSMLPVNSGITFEFGKYLNNRILEYNSYLTHYDANRLLLNMKNIILLRNQYYFQKFKIVVDTITNIIENDDVQYEHSFHPNPAKDIVLITQATLDDKSTQYIEPRNNALDVTEIMRNVANIFFNSAGIPPDLINPYDPTIDPHKFQLWNRTVGTFSKITEIDKFNNKLFGWLYSSTGAQELFKFISQIDILYNGFSIESDVYNFMKDYAIQSSTVKDLPNLLGAHVMETWSNLVNYYTLQKEANFIQQQGIVGTEDTPGLYSILERSLNTTANAKFAWIQKIGHYIINQIWVRIDDQIIDKQFGEWLEIWHQLSKKTQKENGYNTLIGNVSELYTFDNKITDEYELIIPLQFWFCRNIGLSLPLIALHNADVRLYVNLKQFNEVAYYDSFTTFKGKPKLKCNVLAEYIYVEEEERNKLATSKLEYLIDVIQYNGDIEITKNSFNEEKYIDAVTRFKNPCKEFFWVVQRTSYIDGSLPNGERLWNLYSFDINNTINPVKQAKIKFNGRDREQLKDIMMYDSAYSYERHYSCPNVGINVYCFSLDPESTQPQGSANLSRIDDTGIEMNFKDIVINEMNTSSENIKFRWAIYALSNNLLRIFSGLGGLAFEQ